MGRDTAYLKLVAEKYNVKLNFNYQSQEILTVTTSEEPPIGSDPHLVK